MERFGMEGGDQRDLQIAKGILPAFLDRSIEDCDSEPELKLEPLSDTDESSPTPDYGVQTFVLDSVLSAIG
jgi:hypothetical protein